VSPLVEGVPKLPSGLSGSSMTGGFPHGLNSGFLNHFVNNGPENLGKSNSNNILSPLDVLEKNSETHESMASKAFVGGFGIAGKPKNDEDPKQTTKDNIMKMIRKRLNETRVATIKPPPAKI
jgi:hypothetical protein